MSRITLTLESKLGDKLRELATLEDRSMSSVARIALARHFGLAKNNAKTRKRKEAAK